MKRYIIIEIIELIELRNGNVLLESFTIFSYCDSELLRFELASLKKIRIH